MGNAPKIKGLNARGVTSFAALIRLFPSNSYLAEALHAAPGTVRSWIIRDAVPVKYWDALIAAAQSSGIRNVTLRTMVDCATKQEMGNGSNQRSDLRSRTDISAK